MKQEANGPSRHTVYLALGANIGERLKNLKTALQELRTLWAYNSIIDLWDRASRIPWATKISEHGLYGRNWACSTGSAAFCKAHWGYTWATTRYSNGPRPIDIDILFYDRLQIDEGTLIIPHPRLKERTFVLAPLAEIAPDFVSPDTGETVAELLQKLPQEDIRKDSMGLRMEP